MRPALLTVLVLALSTVLCRLAIRNPPTPPTLGDWSAFGAGVAAVISLIWLISGHLENQRQLKGSNQTVAEQLDHLRNAVSALGAIAQGISDQSAIARISSMPSFSGDQLPINCDSHEFNFQLRNIGGGQASNIVVTHHGDAGTEVSPKVCDFNHTIRILCRLTKSWLPLEIKIAFDAPGGGRHTERFLIKGEGHSPEKLS